jgi:hypothetical protein
MKYLILLMLLVSCGDITVKSDPIEGETTSTFGPDFEAWLEYCKGKAQYEFDIGLITENEIDITTRECYYNLDLTLPDLPDLPEEQLN